MIVESHELAAPQDSNGVPFEKPQEPKALEHEFNRLAAEWKEQGEFLSSPTAIADLPAYRAIIALGKPALPLILRDLAKEPESWVIRSIGP